MSEPAIGFRFVVKIDTSVELGVFTKVEGLGASYETTSIKEGGENSYVHTLPGRMKYENIKLTRPVDSTSGMLAAWFTQFQMDLQTGGRLKRCNLAITAVNGNSESVATWTVMETFPVRYSGPTFQAGANSVLTETLELVHNGFWSGGGSPTLSISTASEALSSGGASVVDAVLGAINDAAADTEAAGAVGAVTGAIGSRI